MFALFVCLFWFVLVWGFSCLFVCLFLVLLNDLALGTLLPVVGAVAVLTQCYKSYKWFPTVY